ncbi:MFS transporter [Phenylobacterium sp.]|uniref:MFS transporter n=1 Tax=Phenylobacterium sp. TaxID=1871053 RepID=UPI003BAD70A9
MGDTAAPTRMSRQLKAGIAISALDGIGYGLLIPMLPFVVLGYGGGPAVVTQLVAFYGLAGFLGGPVLGSLSDRFGRPLVLKLTFVGVVVSYAGMLATNSLVWLFAFRIMTGALTGHAAIVKALVTDDLPPERHVGAIASLTATAALAAAFGPAIGALVVVVVADLDQQFRAAVLGALLANGAMLAVALLIWRSPAPAPRPALKPKAAQGERPWRMALPFLAVALTAYGHAVLISTTALFVHARFQWGPKETGLLLALATAAIAGVRFFALDRLRQHVGLSALLSGATALGAAAMVGMALSPSPAGFVACFTLFALADGVFIVLPVASVSVAADPQHRGFYLGWAQGLAALATFASASLNGVVFEAFGPFAPHVLGAGALGLAAASALLASRPARRPVAAE